MSEIIDNSLPCAIDYLWLKKAELLRIFEILFITLKQSHF
jgi:hypothetical protein